MGLVAGPEISQLAWLVWQQSPINMEAGEITSERRLSSRDRERERGALHLCAEKPEIVSLGYTVNMYTELQCELMN